MIVTTYVTIIIVESARTIFEFNETRNINFRLSKCKHCTCKQLNTHGTHIVLFFLVSTGFSELNWKRINVSSLYHYKANMKSECAKIVLALSAIIIVTYAPCGCYWLIYHIFRTDIVLVQDSDEYHLLVLR
jgi:hypothetical protein